MAQHARTHGSGAIVMGVLEDGELPPTTNGMGGGMGDGEGEYDGGENPVSLGAVLFEAAVAVTQGGSSSDGSVTPEPSVEGEAVARKRKREE